MKEQSKFSAFFFGKKIPIEKNKLNYKQLLIYEWDLICRSITNLFIWVVYNALFGLGWYAIAAGNDATGVQFLNSIASGGVYLGYGVGHVALNGIQWLTNKFTKNKSRSDMVQSGSPIPKRSAMASVFLILTIIPLMIWFVGRIVIMVKCSRFKKANGSLKTEEQKLAEDLKSKVATKDEVVDITSKLVKEVLGK